MKINFLSPKPYLITGLTLLVMGFLSVFVLTTDNLGPLISQLRGREISPIGLMVINEKFLTPFKIFSLWSGSLMLFIGLLLKYKKWLESIYLKLEILWLKTEKMKTWRFLLILFIIGFIFKTVLMIHTSEFSLDHDGARYIDLARNISSSEGYISHAIEKDSSMGWPDKLPYHVFTKTPLYPLMMSAFFKFLGVNFFNAGMVNVIFSSLLPILVFLFAYRLTTSKTISIAAALLMFANRPIIDHTTRILAEIPYASLALLGFIFLTRKNTLTNLGWTGFFLGLAFLTRMEAPVLILPIFCLYLFSKNGFKKAVIQTVIILLVFSATISPWLLRNYNLTGHLFNINVRQSSLQHLDLNYENAARAMKPEFSPNETIKTALGYGRDFIINTPLNIIGSALLTFFFALGVYFSNKKLYLPFFAYMILNFLFYPFFAAEYRLLYPLIPFFMIFASLGIINFIEILNKKCIVIPGTKPEESQKSMRSFFRQNGIGMTSGNFDIVKKLIIVVLIIISASSIAFGARKAVKIYFSQDWSMRIAKNAADALKNQKDAKTVMYFAKQLHFLRYFMPGENVMPVPAGDEERIKSIIKKYDANYIVLTKYAEDVGYRLPDFLNAELTYSKQNDIQDLSIKIYKIKI